MSEKRRSKRYPKRLRVAFGEDDYTTSGFTLNVSKRGAFIVSPKPIPIGAFLHVKLFGESKVWSGFEGQVRWRKEVPTNLRQIEHGGVGVRFLSAHEAIDRLLPQLKSEKRFEVVYNTREELELAFTQELKFGGVFVRTELLLPRDSEVVVEIHLDFRQKTLEVPAKVMQAMAADLQAGRDSGLALMFSDGGVAQRELLKFSQD